jgi:hypothetical protein
MFIKTQLVVFINLFAYIYSAISYFSIGALSDTSFMIKGATPSGDSGSISLFINNNAVASSQPDSSGNFKLVAQNLTSATQYTFDLSYNNSRLNLNKNINTLPSRGAAFTKNFTITASSGAKSGSSSGIFTNLLNTTSNMFFYLGDMFSDSVSSDNANDFTNSYINVLASPSQKNLFQSLPLVYTYNELDYGNAAAVRKAYADFFATYTLPNTSQGIYQQFYIGSVLVLVTDSRAFISSDNKSMFGTDQKNWLINSIKAASTDNTVKGIIILFTQEWVYDENAYSRDMVKQSRLSYSESFNSEKQEIANAIGSINFNNSNGANFKSVLMMSGDAKMLAFDNGTNNFFGSFPYLVCGSLDMKGSCYGGPFTHGYFFYETSQYCKVTIYQGSNGNVCYFIQGIYNNNNASQIVLQYDTCRPSAFPGLINIKCPIMWQEKLICAAITIGAILFIFILFYVVFYRLAVYNFNYRVISDDELIDESKYEKVKNVKSE